MGENIEVKDVQKTEYLDKNGLDMLWAKVKENTRNQVEAESNRAVEQETRIIETKADKSEFSNYVPSATFTALEKKVSANTAAISNKQNAGNYLHYETLNDEGYYEIPNVCIPDIDYNLHHTILNPESIQIVTGDLEANDTTGIVIASNGRDPYIALTDSAYKNILKITREGISNADNNANHVYATDGSIADLTQYAKKSEITAGGNVDDVQVNGVSVVENKIANIKPATKEEYGVVKVGDGLNVADGTISVDTTAIGSGKYIPYETFSNDTYYLQNGVTFGSEGEVVYTSITNSGVLVRSSTKNRIEINGNYLFLSNSDGNTITFNSRSGEIEINRITSSGNESALSISGSGIYMYGVGRNRVLTADASTIDITQYALKSELPTVPTKVSQLQNDSEFITKSVYDEKIAALESRIAALEAKHTETA